MITQPGAEPGSSQPATTPAPAIFTATDGSGTVAGPVRTAPVSALNLEPWQGQSSSVAAATATAQPLCVQTALKATTFPAEGCATMMSAPSAYLAATAPPTGTLLSAMMAFAGGATEDEAADVGAAEEVATPEDDAAEDDAAELGAAAEDSADDDSADAAADDATDDDSTDEDATGLEATDDGAKAADEDAADGAVDGAGVLLAAAVPELPQAAMVSAPAPSPAATKAWRRLIGVRGPPAE